MSTPLETSLYRQKDFPVFQNRMYNTEALAVSCPTGDIDIVQNTRTGLVYNRAFRPDLVDYDASYQNEQGVSARYCSHLEEVARIVGSHMSPDGIAEIGCGKGHFLELLSAKGFDVVGFDPAYEGKSPLVNREYFTSTHGRSFKGFILRHVLEHVKDPVAFLKMIRDENGGKGLIYIEAPCLDWKIARNAWYDLYYEHVSYFRLSDFHRMFGKVIDSGRLFGGQYLYAVADLASFRDPVIAPEELIDPQSFMKFDFKEKRLSGAGGAIWGGASKGVIFALLSARCGFPCQRLIDINPAKQGKYVGVTGLMVQSPQDGLYGLADGATVHVMNSNYLDEIVRETGGRYRYQCVDALA
jgi:Methyltransferase domain